MTEVLIVHVIFFLRKLRRFLGLPVLDITDTKRPILSAVNEMEVRQPKAEK